MVGDSSYPTGGSSITPAQLGFWDGVTAAIVSVVASSGSNNTAVSAALTLSSGGTVAKLQCFATSDAAGDPLAEVANTTNLSGLTWQIVAWGW